NSLASIHSLALASVYAQIGGANPTKDTADGLQALPPQRILSCRSRPDRQCRPYHQADIVLSLQEQGCAARRCARVATRTDLRRIPEFWHRAVRQPGANRGCVLPRAGHLVRKTPMGRFGF